MADDTDVPDRAPVRITVRPRTPEGVPGGEGWEPLSQEPLPKDISSSGDRQKDISSDNDWEPISQEPVQASKPAELPQQGVSPQTEPTPQNPGVGEASEGDPWEPVGSDPFELAAFRTRQSVKPGAGRIPGNLTKTLANFVPHEIGNALGTGKAMFEQAERLRYEGDFDPGTTLGAASLALGMTPRTTPNTLGAFGGRITIPPALHPPPELAAGAKVMREILAPETVSESAARAAGLIREQSGRAARDTARTRARLGDDPKESMVGNWFNNFEKRVNRLDPAGRLSMLDYMENRSSWPSVVKGPSGKFQSPGYIPPELKPIADEFRNAMQIREQKLQATKSLADTELIQDYVTHYWKDPAAAAQFVRTWSGKQGRGGNLKKRSIPTISDGIKAGLEPISNNPIEIALRYVENMDKYIAANEVIDVGRAAKDVKYFKPGSRNVPTGWVELSGRLAAKQTPAGLMRAYAPADWARIYNNYISRGYHGNVEAGKVYDALQHANNAITSLQLGLSGFHAFTMANEAFIAGLARGASEMFTGIKHLDPILMGRGAKSIVQAPAKPITNALKGRKVAQTYLGRGHATPDFRRIVKLLEQAGGRAVGRRHAVDYNYSHSGSYWTAWRRGALKIELLSDLTDIKGRPIVGTAKAITRNIGRVLDTVAGPLFERYIPLIKDGAFYDNMKSWLDANPSAPLPEQMKAARTIWDSVDNRFGEMVHDNVFWNKTLKQTAMLGLRSYSWNLGTIREIGGGALNLARHPLSAIDLKSPNYSPRAAYVVAMPVAVATLSAAYQYLKTGEAPQGLDDLVSPRTGGTAPPVGGEYEPPMTKPKYYRDGTVKEAARPRKGAPPARHAVPERAALPGYQKDVFGWYDDWRQEAANKMAPLLSMGAQTLGNQDWRGDPIINPEASAPEWLKQYMTYVGQQLTPFSLTSAGKVKKGSNIGTAARLTGINPARSMFQDPAGAEHYKQFIRDKRWKEKQRHDIKQQSQYGGTE